jgi:hypothetical protein
MHQRVPPGQGFKNPYWQLFDVPMIYTYVVLTDIYNAKFGDPIFDVRMCHSMGCAFGARKDSRWPEHIIDIGFWLCKLYMSSPEMLRRDRDEVWKEVIYLSASLDLCCFEVISVTCPADEALLLTCLVSRAPHNLCIHHDQFLWYDGSEYWSCI